jgi:hypothetical protein
MKAAILQIQWTRGGYSQGPGKNMTNVMFLKKPEEKASAD